MLQRYGPRTILYYSYIIIYKLNSRGYSNINVFDYFYINIKVTYQFVVLKESHFTIYKIYYFSIIPTTYIHNILQHNNTHTMDVVLMGLVHIPIILLILLSNSHHVELLPSRCIICIPFIHLRVIYRNSRYSGVEVLYINFVIIKYRILIVLHNFTIGLYKRFMEFAKIVEASNWQHNKTFLK